MKTNSEKGQNPSLGDWVTVLLGLWILVSPFVLGFSQHTAPMLNNIAVGAAIILLSLINARGGEVVAGAIVVLGGWLFLSPFVLDFSIEAFLTSNVATAFVVIASAAVSEGLRPGTQHQR